MTTKERRPLTEGLKDEPEVPPHLAREFVFQKSQKVDTPAALDVKPATTTRLPAGTLNPANASALVPLTARIPAEKFQALKRASFERQLQGVEPSSMQDIVEEAITPWLRKHGYLP
jgi:hypothetical protein